MHVTEEKRTGYFGLRLAWISLTIVLFSPLVSKAENKPDESPAAADEEAARIDDLRARGIESFEKGEVTEAIKLLGQARALGAEDKELRIAMGRAYLLREMYQKALIEFSEVIKKDPNNIAANIGRAESLTGLGDARKAVGPARLVTEIEPQNAEAWEALGDAYLHEQLQEHHKAQAAFRKVLELRPGDREAALKLARALSFAKEVEQAIEVLEGLVEKDPDDMAVLVKLAESYYAIRKLDKAMSLVEKALDADPEDSEAQRVREQIEARQSYNFWVPVIAIIAFPLLYLLVRWMRKGKLPKVDDD